MTELTRRRFYPPAGALAGVRPALAQDKFIVMSVDDVTEQSGLFAHLLPAVRRPPASMRVVALGTGQALDIARRGDADVVFVHDQAAEEKFVAEGFGVKTQAGHVQRLRADRAEGRSGRRGKAATIEALRRRSRIQRGVRPRGDKSGTHAAELRYWKAAGVDPGGRARATRTRLGMGPALNIAVDRRLRAHRPRHPAVVQELRPRDPGRGRQASSTSTA